ncbi:MAG: cellobiose phosphorylase, partial [bacterium]
LFNEHGMKSSITPTLGGDVKIDQNHFAMAPASQATIDDPHNARSVFFEINGDLYSITGKTPFQKLHPDSLTLEAGLLDQTIIRTNSTFKVAITSFVPAIAEDIELHKIVFTNLTDHPLKVKPTVAFPIYGRSADNIRDHRHVTALLNRAYVCQEGIINEPTLSFDERGHLPNKTAYGVFARSDRHDGIAKWWPVAEEFVGEGHDMFYPLVPRSDLASSYKPGDVIEGYETLGGLEFAPTVLAAGTSITIIVGYFIGEGRSAIMEAAPRRLAPTVFDALLTETRAHWQKETAAIQMQIGTPALSGWLSWVGIQPIMRRIYGCSFLPDHDYGRGGRGWRDLWQDSLALTLLDPKSARAGIVNNLRGVRIDGSNATIVGMNPGEFVADRNNIVRVWSDHGAWPFLTCDFYLNRTGDFGLLEEKAPYFKDKFAAYTKAVDPDFIQNGDNTLLDVNGKPYLGTMLEHLILENVIPFFNVGDHGCVRLEGADWNDGLDMATNNGETVAFTAMYAGNLTRLADLIDHLRKTRNWTHVIMPEEAGRLFGTLKKPLTGDPAFLRSIRDDYFTRVQGKMTGRTIKIDIIDLIADLKAKSKHWKNLINSQEWIAAEDGSGWYNGYYDDAGRQVDSAHPGDIRMTLTGQVFPMLAGIVPADRYPQIVRAVHHHLQDPKTGCIRLNTDLRAANLKLGRFAGFAFGHKENGALFSHMAVMYAYGLFAGGFASEGNAVFHALSDYLGDIDKSKILPGIPEYIDPRGRGLYPYLTGSAAWTVIAHVERIFGIRGVYGDLVIEPKLERRHFADGEASCAFLAGDRRCRLVVRNPENRELGGYVVTAVRYGGKNHEINGASFTIAQKDLDRDETIVATLGKAA